MLGLTLITFGIYYVFWYYFINREMRDLGKANGVDLGDSPGMSVVAITLGAFIIVPPFVSIWKTGRRMEGAQRRWAGGQRPAVVRAAHHPVREPVRPRIHADRTQQGRRSRRAGPAIRRRWSTPRRSRTSCAGAPRMDPPAEVTRGARPEPARAQPRACAWGRRRSRSSPAARCGTGSGSGSTSR